MIFNLITKEIHRGKPTNQTLEEALRAMRREASRLGVAIIAIPEIGSGLDLLHPAEVKAIIHKVFDASGIRILMYHLRAHGKKNQVKRLERQAAQAAMIAPEINPLMRQWSDSVVSTSLETELRTHTSQQHGGDDGDHTCPQCSYQTNLPRVTISKVREIISKINPNKGNTEGDVHPKLYLAALDSIQGVVKHLFERVTQTGEWPTRWKREHSFPLKKIPHPQSLNDIRAISRSSFLSAQYEKLVVEWLVDVVGHQIDWAKYGTQKGCATTHLIIELLTFIHYNLNLRKKHAITLTIVDYHKAFNRQDHNNFLVILHRMGVPGWLLRIIAGFLEDRTMTMAFRQGRSESKSMPGGGPAGTTLSLLMFIVLVNSTANPGTKQQWGQLLSAPFRGRKSVDMLHGKFIDDVTLGESIDMRKKLVSLGEAQLTRPVTYRERCGLSLPEDQNGTSAELEKIAAYADANYMKINKAKTKVMLINPKRRAVDFLPEIKIRQEKLEVINETRLVGVIITDDMKWDKQIADMSHRAFTKIWILRRLKSLGATRKSLLLIYYRHIRSIVEYAAPAWHKAITHRQADRLERVQRVALKLIFGHHKSYRTILAENKLQTLKRRRTALTLKFAKKALKHQKFRQWFKALEAEGKMAQYAKPQARCKRLMKSPIPYMTELLNQFNSN